MDRALSHVDEAGAARMVDVSKKPRVHRTAKAAGRVDMAPATVELIRRNALEKGDVLAVARIAGIMGAKRAAELIPLCHNIEIEQVTVDLSVDEGGVAIVATALCSDKTGIEMEALTAVSIAALTIYDMCKAADKAMVLRDIRLVEKTKEEIE
jgi:cyclic pyranopterin phosphate synthase